MRIGRIGSYGTTPYVQSANRVQDRVQTPGNSEQDRQKKLPGWQGRDSFEASQSNEDGRVTPTGTYDYLMKAAANAARFDSENFDL